MGESTVRRYVCQRRRELGVGTQVFVPQSHPIGAQAEADFYEAEIDFSLGTPERPDHHAALGVLRCSPARRLPPPDPGGAAGGAGARPHLSGRGLSGAAPGQLALGGLKDPLRQPSQGAGSLHRVSLPPLFHSSFTSLGIQGAHEKGGVENEVGRFRRRWLTPVPQACSWEDLNAYLRRCCITDLERKLPGRSMSIGEAMAMEQEFLKPLPQERFELAEISKPTVDSKARIRVKTQLLFGAGVTCRSNRVGEG